MFASAIMLAMIRGPASPPPLKEGKLETGKISMSYFPLRFEVTRRILLPISPAMDAKLSQVMTNLLELHFTELSGKINIFFLFVDI